MKKAITFLLLFVILLSAAGCTDHIDIDPEETNQTNASSDQSVTGTVTEKESTSTTVSQGKTEPPDKKQPTNGTGTNPPDQTNVATATETSSPSDTQTTSSAEPPFVTGNNGVDLPIDLFD